MKDKIGVVHGRFQILHNDHMKYILAAKDKCDYLLIGICNPEIELTKYDAADPGRSRKSSNPLTYFERFECIKNALLDAGVPGEEFDIVPFPINFPEKIGNYVPLSAVFYMTIYDEWGKEKYNTLHDNLGLNVKVMWEVDIKDKGISSGDIRNAIFNNKEWAHLVPKSVYNYISENKLDKRITQYVMQDSSYR